METATPTKSVCPACGSGKIAREVIDLGKTSGEEGHDFIIMYHCPDCSTGHTAPEEKPQDCMVCGKPATKGLASDQIVYLVAGFLDWAPGIPNVIPWCGRQACFKAVEKTVEKAVSEAFYE